MLGEVVTHGLATSQTPLRYNADAGSAPLRLMPQVPHFSVVFVANYCPEEDEGLRAAGHRAEALPAR